MTTVATTSRPAASARDLLRHTVATLAYRGAGRVGAAQAAPRVALD